MRKEKSSGAVYGIPERNEKDVEEWDVLQSEVSRGAPAGDVHGTCPFSDTHLRSMFLILSHVCVSVLPIITTKLN